MAADYAAHFPDTWPETPLDLAMVDALCAVVAHGRVLDAGCGAGRMSRYLADREIAVTGVDLSPGMVAQARHAHPDLDFTVGTLDQLPYAGGDFDGVLLWYSTIHTAPTGQPAIYREAARVLRPGGHVLVGFQHGSGVRDVAPAYRRRGHEVELVRYPFTADEVSSWLASAGLTEVARLVRAAGPGERDGQAMVLAHLPG